MWGIQCERTPQNVEKKTRCVFTCRVGFGKEVHMVMNWIFFLDSFELLLILRVHTGFLGRGEVKKNKRRIVFGHEIC